MSRSLIEVFETARVSQGVPPQDVELQALVDRARAERSELAVDAVGLVEHIARQSGVAEAPSVIPKLYAGDLALAVGALAGDSTAFRVLDVVAIVPSRPAIMKLCGGPSETDDVLQELRKRLISGEVPALRTYSGVGPLGAWIRISAVRSAMKRKQRTAKEVPFSVDLVAEIDASFGGGAPSRSARLGLEKAVREAFAALPARQRVVMQMYYRDGSELSDIAQVYGVHSSTASRWIKQGRELVAEYAYAALHRGLGLTRTEARWLLGFAEEVDANMTSLLSLGRGGDG